jgi:hypothetical protein
MSYNYNNHYFKTISFCAQQDSIKGADVVIVDNGACGEFCPPL